MKKEDLFQDGICINVEIPVQIVNFYPNDKDEEFEKLFDAFFKKVGDNDFSEEDLEEYVRANINLEDFIPRRDIMLYVDGLDSEDDEN